MAQHLYELCILLDDRPYERNKKINGDLNLKEEKARKGDLLKYCETNNVTFGGVSFDEVFYCPVYDPNKRVLCDKGQIAGLTKDQFQWLLAITHPSDRFAFYSEGKLEQVLQLNVEDHILVNVRTEKRNSRADTCCSAVVKYIGPLLPNPGRYLGLQLQEKWGNCNGKFKGKRLFSCDLGYGIFLPANHFIACDAKLPTAPQKGTQNSSNALMKKTSSMEGVVDISASPPFQEGDRVIVFTKEGKETHGTTKWSIPGHLYDQKGTLIGIEMDDPIEKDNVPQHLEHLVHHVSENDDNHLLIIPQEYVVEENLPVDVQSLDEAPSNSEKGSPERKGSPKKFFSKLFNGNQKNLAEKKAKAEQKQHLKELGITPLEYQETIRLQKEYEEKKLKSKPLPHQDCIDLPVYDGSKGLGSSRQRVGSDSYLYHHTREKSPVSELTKQISEPIQHFATPNGTFTPVSFEVGMEVEARLREEPEIHYGVIRWIGTLPRINRKIAGVELNYKKDGGGDGSWDGKIYFTCPEGYAMFVALENLRPIAKVQVASESDSDFDPNKKVLQKEVKDLKQSLVRAETISHSLKKDNDSLKEEVTELKQKLDEIEQAWTIQPASLNVTGRELGRGAWGEVKIGVYCGGRVAVKRMHQIIVSEYNIQLFKREMDIVARLRHPHLVLFIGAVTTGTLTIVTELMETSLRKQLELRRISEKHILPISRDVACALNYLHSLPEPIIHRDVSSANVLLNSKPGGRWMAKLGDFGSANLLSKLGTVAPGCVAYAAPECQTPALQGPKMDVYSYGVLLFEMFTGHMPELGQLENIRERVPFGFCPDGTVLAVECTHQEMEQRPAVTEVLERLNDL